MRFTTLLLLLLTISCNQQEKPPAPLSLALPTCRTYTAVTTDLTIYDDYTTEWTNSLHDMCLGYNAQVSWTPWIGHIIIRSRVPICAHGFTWLSVQGFCTVPTYTVTATTTYNFYELDIKFDPDECLAESVPNVYKFKFFMACR